MRKIFILIIAVTVSGCLNKKVEITADYIVNPNWDDQANSLKINKLKLRKDSVVNPFSDLSQKELLEKLEDDSSFLFVANVKFDGEKYSKRKVYFDKPNGFYWYSNNGESKSETICKLKEDNWYKFSHLVTYPYYIYVFVDNTSKVHHFGVNLANY